MPISHFTSLQCAEPLSCLQADFQAAARLVLEAGGYQTQHGDKVKDGVNFWVVACSAFGPRSCEAAIILKELPDGQFSVSRVRSQHSCTVLPSPHHGSPPVPAVSTPTIPAPLPPTTYSTDYIPEADTAIHTHPQVKEEVPDLRCTQTEASISSASIATPSAILPFNPARPYATYKELHAEISAWYKTQYPDHKLVMRRGDGSSSNPPSWGCVAQSAPALCQFRITARLEGDVYHVHTVSRLLPLVGRLADLGQQYKLEHSHGCIQAVTSAADSATILASMSGLEECPLPFRTTMAGSPPVRAPKPFFVARVCKLDVQFKLSF